MAIFNTVYGGEWKWKPWSNTLLYLPLNWNLNDESWNWYNWTWSAWTEKYATLSSWLQVAEFSWWLSRVTTSFTQTPTTISLRWYKSTSLSDPSVNGYKLYAWQASSDSGNWWRLRMVTSSSTQRLWYQNGSEEHQNQYNYKDTWVHMVATYNGSNTLFYINWSLVYTYTSWMNAQTWLYLWTSPRDTTSTYSLYWYVSNVIIEGKQRTAQEVAKYYNSTKSNYS